VLRGDVSQFDDVGLMFTTDRRRGSAIRLKV
jgi:hypothetical protein